MLACPVNSFDDNIPILFDAFWLLMILWYILYGSAIIPKETSLLWLINFNGVDLVGDGSWKIRDVFDAFPCFI